MNQSGLLCILFYLFGNSYAFDGSSGDGVAILFHFLLRRLPIYLFTFAAVLSPSSSPHLFRFFHFYGCAFVCCCLTHYAQPSPCMGALFFLYCCRMPSSFAVANGKSKRFIFLSHSPITSSNLFNILQCPCMHKY